MVVTIPLTSWPSSPDFIVSTVSLNGAPGMVVRIKSITCLIVIFATGNLKSVPAEPDCGINEMAPITEDTEAMNSLREWFEILLLFIMHFLFYLLLVGLRRPVSAIQSAIRCGHVFIEFKLERLPILKACFP